MSDISDPKAKREIVRFVTGGRGLFHSVISGGMASRPCHSPHDRGFIKSPEDIRHVSWKSVCPVPEELETKNARVACHP